MKNYSKYLSVSNFEKEWGCYVTTAGYTKIDTHQSYPPNSTHPDSHAFNWDAGRILDGYYLVFISKGCGIFESAASKSRHINAGNCFMLFPGEWHRYKPATESGWEEYWVGFKGAYIESLMGKVFSKSDPFVTTGLNDTLLKLFHQLIDDIQKAAAGYHQIIAGITMQMLGVVHSFYTNNCAGNTTFRLIEEAKFLLRESIQSPDNIERIVKKLPVSYSKLRKDFKAVTGESPNQYQLNLRLEKAKELLTSTSLSVSEIAYQTGFESVFYLSRIFKSKNNVSPRAYRLGDGLH
jgi:AraC-like DNA-binding protein